MKTRGIQVQEKESKFLGLLETPQNPLHKSIELSEDKASLIWPVVLLYPEYGQTEYIEAFDEYHRLEDHLRVMFAEMAPWDSSRTYTYDLIEVRRFIKFFYEVLTTF